jgi:PAS domain S-box-containing protein
MRNTANKSDTAAMLYQKAEALLKIKLPAKTGSQHFDADILKLMHEIEVYQIELEMQNEELRLAKKQSEIATEKYIELYDFAPSGYFTLSNEGKITALNLSGAKILGKERSHLKNSLFGFFVSDNTKPIFNLFLSKVFSSHTKEACEITLLINENSPMYVYLTGIVTGNGEQCLAIMIDITEHKQAENLKKKNKELTIAKEKAELSEEITTKFSHELNRTREILAISETRYRRLFESAKDGILILDAENGKIVDVNPFLIDLLGYTKEQFVEKAIWEIGFFKDIVANQDKFLELQQKTYVRYEDLPLETADGRKIHVEFVSNVYSANYLKVIQCNIRDITDRKHAELKIQQQNQELIKVNDDKDRFMSILAHDLKSPFSVLLGFATLLKEKIREYNVDEIEERITIINSAAQNVYNLLEDILMWARAQSGKIPYNPQKLNFTNVCEDVVEILKPNANAKNISINYFIGEEITFFADIDMLKTILRNLISNSIKFTNPGGKIDIYAWQDHQMVTISVADNGIGIAPDILAKLFDISQTHTSRGTAEETGTGLGLFLCKEFVEKHGGLLLVRSKLNKGSDFKFTLPVNEYDVTNKKQCEYHE